MNSSRRGFNLGLLFLLVGISVVGWLKIDALSDWWKLRGYNPDSTIVGLAQQDTMTDVSKHYFFVNHPQLLGDRSQFTRACPQAEQTIVLGCYHGGERGIALFSVQDQRLQGILQVTAAHETLHGIYERLDSKEKAAVNAQLLDYYNNHLTDQRVKNTIDLYKKSEPDSVVDEMHSIFGTELSELPAPLEKYYSKYFTSRQQVVAYSNNYEAVFVQNQQQLDSLSKQIDALKSTLNDQKQQIEADQNSLQEESSRLQSLLQSGRTAEYNSAVPGYNARVQSLKSEIASYNANVSRVNSLVEQYNALAYTQQSLYKSIDTRIQSQSAQ